jgi:hypothetical protein
MTKEIDYVELLKLAHEKLGSQSDMITELEKERDEYHAMVVYMGAIMDESEGVAGYHLNGDIAKWDDLFTTSILEDATSIRDLEQQAIGAYESVWFCKFEGVRTDEQPNRHISHLLNARVKELRNQAKSLKEQE